MRGTHLRLRSDSTLPERFARSGANREAGHFLRTDDVARWMAERAAAHAFAVKRIAFEDLHGWSFDPRSGNLAHDSGRFFTVEGLAVDVDDGERRRWEQPIIRQPETGILGLVAQEFDGVLHFLLQAKMEPGNPNLLQLSPTVQATRSNYTGVHRGAKVRHLEYFVDPSRADVLVDVLQSEHGAWFYRKFNRNMLVEVHDEIDAGTDFCWLTLGQIGRLLERDNVVNMDTRTILACLPLGAPGAVARHTDAQVQSWFTVERSKPEVDVRRIPLSQVDGWSRGPDSVHHSDDRFFRVVAVSVNAGSREVTAWTQPLFEPIGTGISAFLVRRLGGTPHLLVQAKVEAGFLDRVEIAPTVQCIPDNWDDGPTSRRPRFLDVVAEAALHDVRYAARHSEEGGRFLSAQNRCLFVETDEERAPLDPPPGYCWVTPGQLSALTRHGHYVNVQARTLLACLHSGAAVLEPVR